jgi:uncharacterized protein YukE
MAVGFLPLNYTETLRYNLAAKQCDELADELVDQAGKIYQLQDQVEAAWKGDAGTSLDGALVDKAGSLTSAAGILRGAANELRAEAARRAKK